MKPRRNTARPLEQTSKRLLAGVWIHLTCGFTVLHLAGLTVGLQTPVFARSAVLLTCIIWLLAAARQWCFTRVRSWRGAALLFCLLVFCRTTSRLQMVFAAVALIAAIGSLLRHHPSLQLAKKSLNLSAFSFALLLFCHHQFPISFHGLVWFSRQWSAILPQLNGGFPVQLGPGPLGVWIWLSFTCFITAVIGLRRAAVGKGIATIIWLWALALMLSALFTTNIPVFQSHQFLASTGWLILPAGLIFCAWRLGSCFYLNSPVITQPRARNREWLCCLALLLMIFAAAKIPASTPKTNPHIFFYNVNQGPLLDWEKPERGKYTTQHQGMFGLLPGYLAAHGFTSSFINQRSQLSQLNGKTNATLVTINVDTQWTRAELNKIWDFVKQGGSLLVLGDHSDFNGTRQSHNQLLAPVGIHFRYDGAMTVKNAGWSRAFSFSHPLTAAVGKPSKWAIGLGASLELRGTGVKPLLVAPAGLSDKGDPQAPKRGFLGDYRYQPGEPVGDIVLAAWAPLGKGKILAFGDTSGFQNPLASDVYFTTVQPVFQWLASHQQIRPIWLSLILAVLLLVAFSVFVTVVQGRTGAIAAVALFILLLLALNQRTQRQLLTRPHFHQPTAWLDLSHGPRITGGRNKQNQTNGLEVNCLRQGFAFRTMKTFQPGKWQPGDVVILLAPAATYTRAEVKQCKAFVKSGGTILLACGYFHKKPVAGLLRAFAVDIGANPIGAIPLHKPPGRRPMGVEYTEAWPLEIKRTAAKSSGDTGAHAAIQHRILGRYRQFPLAVRASFGKGAMVVIGDSCFFSARNLEDEQTYSLPNMHFLAAAINQRESLP